jgi:hypothetical protein
MNRMNPETSCKSCLMSSQKSYVKVPVNLTVIPSFVSGVNVAFRAASSAASRSTATPF